MEIDRKTLIIAVLLLIIIGITVSSFLTATYDAGYQQGATDQVNFIISQVQQSGLYAVPLNEQVNLICGFQEIQT